MGRSRARGTARFLCIFSFCFGGVRTGRMALGSEKRGCIDDWGGGGGREEGEGGPDARRRCGMGFVAGDLCERCRGRASE